MRSLLLAVLVSWACAEPRQYTHPHPTADATGEEAATLVQAPEGPVEEYDGGQEEQEEEQEEQEEEQEPAKTFSYEEWTAEPPTRGEPKIPGPPFPHVDAEGKKGLYERIRRLRWDIWPKDRVVLAREAWLDNWEKWIEDGHLATAAAQPDAQNLCRNDLTPQHLRANDPTLRELLDEFRIAYPLREEQERLQRSRREVGKIRREEISIFDTGAANYYFKLIELQQSIDTKYKESVGRVRAVVLKIKRAYGCRGSPFNSCWTPSPLITVEALVNPKCADQR